MSTFVLIPGAGGTSWYWHRVSSLLTAAGHTAIPVDLPGDDPMAGLQEYAAIVEAAMRDRGSVTLVASSLGGFTAAAVTAGKARAAVGGLVFVNAMIPAPGETAGAWWDNTGAVPARIAAAEAGGYSPDFDLDTYFLHDVPADVAADGAPYQRDESDAVFASVCEFGGWPAIPIRAVAGASDRFFPVEFQRRVARERLGQDIDVLPGGHLIALSQPEALSDYLVAD